jgi:hypothetical protein
MKHLTISALLTLIAALTWLGIHLHGASKNGRSEKPLRVDQLYPGAAIGPFSEEGWRDALPLLTDAFRVDHKDNLFAPHPSNAETGRAISHSRCAACHVHPEPALLPKVAWIEVFLHKRRFFSKVGLLPFTPLPLDVSLFEQSRARERPNMWEAATPPTLTEEEFLLIVEYYLHEAPLHPLPQEAKATGDTAQAPFEVGTVPELRLGSDEGFVMVRVEDGRLFLGTNQRELQIATLTGKLLARLPLPGVPVHAARSGDDLLVTVIGPDLGSIQQAAGSVHRIADAFTADVFHTTSLLEGLYRPIGLHVFGPALASESTRDALLVEFGMFDGSVDWYRYDENEDSLTKKRSLIDASGAVGLHIGDMTGNGLDDIVVLLSQARQSLYLFRNRGAARFEKERIFQFPPSYGFNSLTVADINGNGHLDIITTNGDNGDLLSTTPLRRYHGIRVFVNDGDANFTEVFFYPMHGAIQTIIGDFTGNGAQDIAGIAYYPNADERPMETFVLLENMSPGTFSGEEKTDTGLSFQAKHVAGTGGKPWIAMAAGDLSGRDRPGIVLATLEIPHPAFQRYFQDRQTPNLILLTPVDH